MPMFKVKLKPLNPDHENQEVSVWAENGREAGIQAIKVARKLLRTTESFELVDTINLSPSGTPPKPFRPRTEGSGVSQVLTRFI